MSDEAQVELPRYKCHKEVHALKIKAIARFGIVMFITPEDEGYAKFPVDEEYVRRHQPQAGGYYVVYADGYKSFSPAAAFESGYTRMISGDWRERVKQEKAELDKKLHDLTTALRDPILAGIPLDAVDLLAKQATYMRNYSEILAERLKRFK